MKTVAIISEYNPFHTGHEYHINKIRSEFGNDTRIIAIMSGNYTQRGEIAIMDKSKRAECAVRCGVNLVLEIPFPYSMSSAEFFAKSGVKIANSLGIVDYVSFGSEIGDADLLRSVAENMSDKEYLSAIKAMMNSDSSKEMGYPKLCETVYRQVFGSAIPSSFFSPNNILALEYIKALLELKSNINVHTVKRFGSDFSEEKITSEQHQSASAIRKLMLSNFNSALDYIPKNTIEVILNQYENKLMPCDSEKLAASVIAYFRLNFSPHERNIHDAGGGLYNRLRNASYEANSINTLIKLAGTKKYTESRIKRAMWYSFFGVTSSTVKELPQYTQILAMDTIGKSILKEVKKLTDFPILTKPSSFDALSDKAKKCKQLSDSADSVFHLTKPIPPSGRLSLQTTPYIKK